MTSLSVILPTYNSASTLPETLRHLRVALAVAAWVDAQIVIVDDGSTDETAALLAADVGLPPLTIVRQENAGRFRAREAGLKAATGELVLFIDSRVHAHEDSLRFVREQLASHPERMVWNGHVEPATGSSIFSWFWNALTFLAWRRYLREPRLMSYGAAEYDYYPKGTTFFLAPRQWLVDAVEGFSSAFDDLHHANDDTLMIRPLAERAEIFLSPEFSCTYFPRDSARKFLVHSFHRGTVFVDGYYRPGTRFYRPLQAACVIAPLGLAWGIRHPLKGIAAVGLGSAALGVFARARGVTSRDAASLAVLAPLFGSAYGSGIARGLLLRSRQESRS